MTTGARRLTRPGMSAVTRSVAGFPTGVFPELRDWIVVAGRSEQRRDDYPECDRMTSSTDAQEMAESGVAAHALLFEPLTLHDLTIKTAPGCHPCVSTW